MLQQQLLHVAAHVPGDEHVKISGGGQHGQALLVGLPRAQRCEEPQALPLQSHGPVLTDLIQRDLLLLRRREDRPLQRGLLSRRGKGNGVHRHPLQQLGHAIGVVIVEVGNHQQVQLPAAHAPDIVGGDVSSVIHAVAAAVHQSPAVPAAQQDALPLAHVQHRRRHGPAPEGAHRQGHGGTQSCGADGSGYPKPLLALDEDPGQQDGIYQRQPGPVVEGVHGQRSEGDVGQLGDDPVQIPGQRRRRRRCRSTEHGAGHRQDTCEQTARKDQPHRPQGEQVRQQRDDGHRAEIQGHQGRCEHHSAQGGGQGGHHEEHRPVQQPHGGKAPPLFRLIAGKGPVLNGIRAAEDPRHRQKGQLKPHMGRGKGVLDQNEQQGKAQGRGAVSLSVEQGRDLQHQDHHRRPHHRGSAARHRHKQQHQRDQHQCGAPPPPAQQQGQGSRQKGHMHPGHGHGVGQAGTLKG